MAALPTMVGALAQAVMMAALPTMAEGVIAHRAQAVMMATLPTMAEEAGWQMAEGASMQQYMRWWTFPIRS